jgi:hypothetical protein
MKSLWTLRHSDGRLMKFDGASWSAVGTFAPTQWPTTTSYYPEIRATCGCFVYRGKLHTRWQGINTSTNLVTSYIGAYNGTDVTQTAATSTIDCWEFWGPVINYKGRIYWFATKPSRTGADERNHLFLYCFYYDGSNVPQFVRRRCDEIGSVANWNNNSFLDGGAGGNSNQVPLLRDYRDRLMLSNPPGVTGLTDSNNTKQFWDWTKAIDIDLSTNNVSASTMMTQAPGFWTYSWHMNTSGSFDKTGMNTYYVATCNWKDRIYGLTYDNKLYAYNPATDTRSLVQDLSEDAAFGAMGGATYTTDVAGGTVGWTLGFNADPPIDPAWRRQGYAMKVKVLNYNGTPGSTRYGWILNHETDTNPHIRVWDDTSNAEMTAQPSGTQFKLFWNWANGYSGNGAASDRYCYMFVHNGKLYILGLSTRTTEDSNVTYNNPSFYPSWTLSVWAGTGAVTTTKYAFVGSMPTVAGFQVAVDTAGGELHLLTYDNYAQFVEHRKISLTSPYPMASVGTVYTRTGPNNFERFMGLVVDGAAFFDQTDSTATIESRASDPDAGTITITYKLWSSNTQTDSIAVEYDTMDGLGWQAATRKTGFGEGLTSLTSSSGGTSHTFVHDVTTDLGSGFVGTIQHRIRITSQTRN